ncbi:hypothetical protein NX722_28370 [Endozoicomonas gorgoniicola]|uniref:Uncharacterized protein n=1 Tax=Endozoicomonas gorgoniicola TaxID=1234144 RepID=A0ABT3N4C3_9GAMM|nr:hypothetical protein [Endozoicomonas gorgoniicola]MCW7556482.1 hypothetical protein [Endozoicomonas gorgoniicola]
MDHKKAGTIRLSYTRADGVKVTKDYQAEFNDATFSGDVSSLTGTFRGTLTADAINAVKNVTIAGNSVARSFYVYHPNPINVHTDGYQVLSSIAFNIPSGIATSRITAIARATFRLNIDHGSWNASEIKKIMHFRTVMNGVVVDSFDSRVAMFTQKYKHVPNPLLQFNIVAPCSVGLNSLSVQMFVSNSGPNIYPTCTNREFVVDVVFK